MPGAVGEPGQPRPIVRHYRRRVLRVIVEVSQTVAAIVLLVLASVIDSPRHPGRKQSQKTVDTPNPQVFQAWLGLAAGRLAILALIGIWLLHRDGRKPAVDAEEVETVPMAQTTDTLARPASTATQPPLHNPSSASVNLHPYRSTTSVNRSTVTLGRTSQIYSTPGAASSQVSWVTAASPASPRSISPPLERDGGSISPAAHLYAIPAAADTLASLASMMPGNSDPSTPSMTQGPSTPNLSSVSSPAAAASTHSLPPNLDKRHSARITYPTPAAVSTVSLALPTSRSTASLALPNSNAPRASSRPNSCPPPRAYPDSTITPIPETHTPNPYPEPYVSQRDRRVKDRGAWAEKLDKVAKTAKWYLQALGWAQFIWAFPLLFYPSTATSEYTPLKGSPLLWWGVVAVVISNWLYLTVMVALILFVITLFLFLQGWALLCQLMGWENRLPPAPFDKPVIKLSQADLARLPIVCYLPHPDEPAPVPSIYGDGQSVRSGSGEPEGSLVLPGQAEPSRLNIPSVELQSHQSTCAICQSSFVAPRDVPGRIMYEVTKIRHLPCNHYFHVDCVDKWLLDHSSVCPYCNRSVRDMLNGKEGTEGTTVEVAPARP